MLSHEELCKKAKAWLRGTRRCEPVFSNIASCSEIPDAIGWSSCYQWLGSTVVECKTSVSDFYADKKKRTMWCRPGHEDSPYHKYRGYTKKDAGNMGLIEVPVDLMGDYRYYLCEPEIITAEMVANNAPDHGLLWQVGRQRRVIVPAPKRTNVDKDGEIRYLRFAIINRKQPWEHTDEWEVPLEKEIS